MNKHVALFLNILSFVYLCVEGAVIALLPKRFRSFKNVRGEVVLITGGGSGIGRLLALRFCAIGAKVVIWDVNEAGNLETVRQVKDAGGEIYSYKVDVSDRAAVYAAAETVKQDVGVVRILFNNAGIVAGRNILDLPDEKLVKTFEVNTLAHFWTVKAFLPDMIAGNHGHVVTISSMAGLVGCPQMTDYCATKFAVVGLDEALRCELFLADKHNVYTTVVLPFFTSTGLFEGVNTGPIPLQDPDYVANEIVDAVLTNQEVLLVPWYLQYVVFLKNILSRTAQMSLYTLLGGREFMCNFVGRQGVKTTTENGKVIAG